MKLAALAAFLRGSLLLCLAGGLGAAALPQPPPSPGWIEASRYSSIQSAIDANPGKVIWISSSEFQITQAIQLRAAGTELRGPGRIVQTRADEPIVVIRNAADCAVRDLVLTRSPGAQETSQPGLLAEDCEGLILQEVRVLDNQTSSAALRLQNCRRVRIESCEIRNYKRISIDDRTGSEHYGYAFHCFDGHGLIVNQSQDLQILNNRIIEERLLPTRAAKEKHRLGQLTEGRHPSKPGTLNPGAIARGYVDNWHQGSAILVTNPESSERVRLSGNYLENSAQGIDLHADRIVCTENIIRYAMIGIKAMHGSRHLVISQNLISHVDLWAIMLGPGTASHGPEAPTASAPGRPANTDGSTLISGNIISDYGHGHEYWNWGGASADQGSSFVIRLDKGQLDSNPPLSDVLIFANILSDPSQSGLLEEGTVAHAKPRYRYALFVEQPPETARVSGAYPRNVRVFNNLFHPGTSGVSNIKLNE